MACAGHAGSWVPLEPAAASPLLAQQVVVSVEGLWWLTQVLAGALWLCSTQLAGKQATPGIRCRCGCVVYHDAFEMPTDQGSQHVQQHPGSVTGTGEQAAQQDCTQVDEPLTGSGAAPATGHIDSSGKQQSSPVPGEPPSEHAGGRAWLRWKKYGKLRRLSSAPSLRVSNSFQAMTDEPDNEEASFGNDTHSDGHAASKCSNSSNSSSASSGTRKATRRAQLHQPCSNDRNYARSADASELAAITSSRGATFSCCITGRSSPQGFASGLAVTLHPYIGAQPSRATIPCWAAATAAAARGTAAAINRVCQQLLHRHRADTCAATPAEVSAT
mmetsp:Transcript_138338/g.275741  ORF Transcript_138338/g.275741 Transcript_138338/m.275741 type:complete len:330 (+) Transcript_138338:32-1021(+)